MSIPKPNAIVTESHTHKINDTFTSSPVLKVLSRIQDTNEKQSMYEIITWMRPDRR